MIDLQDVAAELEMDTGAFQKILGKALAAARAAEAAKKARDLVRRKSVLTKSTLPGKLSDCTSSNLAESEIFLVEGDSAGAFSPSPRRRALRSPTNTEGWSGDHRLHQQIQAHTFHYFSGHILRAFHITITGPSKLSSMACTC